MHHYTPTSTETHPMGCFEHSCGEPGHLKAAHTPKSHRKGQYATLKPQCYSLSWLPTYLGKFLSMVTDAHLQHHQGYTSQTTTRYVGGSPMGKMSTLLPRNLVVGADTMSYSQSLFSAWAAPTGGWWLTCTAVQYNRLLGTTHKH